MKYMIVILLCLLATLYGFTQPLPVISPEEGGFDAAQLTRVDGIIESSIQNNETPGAVLIVVRDSSIVYRKAYGNSQLVPDTRPMEIQTIFDLASITKPVATATSIMLLVERGLIRLSDPVSLYIPGFQPWKQSSDGREEPIRIIHLLTHTSGLPAYAPVAELSERYGHPYPDGVIDYLKETARSAAPGSAFTYSCPNFITLQRIVEIVSGQSLADFSRLNIFIPLGMLHTFFEPDSEFASMVAPTEIIDGNILLAGTVHDPLARVMMGCISGNAGLFSTGDDLALFAAMMLNRGSVSGKRILSPASVDAMTGVPVGYEKFGRGLGWDLHSAYASNKGDLFGPKTYGHTGYTGTSIVIDPDSRTAVILLTNRVHPDDKASVLRLRSMISNVVAAAVRR